MAIEFLEAVSAGVSIHSMVSHRFRLDQANDALATTARWESAKSVIVPG